MRLGEIAAEPLTRILTAAESEELRALMEQVNALYARIGLVTALVVYRHIPPTETNEQRRARGES